MLEFELVLMRSALERMTTELRYGNGKLAVVPLIANRLPNVMQLIANQAPTLIDHPISGQHRSAADQWLLVEVASGNSASHPEDIVDRSELRVGQLLGLLQFGIGGDPSRWRGLLVQNGNYYPLDRIRLIGPGMHTIPRREVSSSSRIDSVEAEPSKSANDPWSRLRGAVGSHAMDRMHASSVLLFGAGKLGSLIGLSLVMHGIERLTIVDFDRLESHNLFATYGATPTDIGSSKARVLATFLHYLRPDCAVHAMEHSVNHPAVIERGRGVDLIVDCVDNDTPRIAASMLSNRFLKPNLSLGTIVRSSSGDASDSTSRELGIDVKMLLPGTCQLCAQGIANREAAVKELATSPAQQLHLHRPEWNSDGRLGSLPSLNLMAVGMAIQLWTDLLTEQLQHSLFCRTRWVEGIGLQSASSPIVGRKNCKLCGDLHWNPTRQETDRERFARLQRFVAQTESGH